MTCDQRFLVDDGRRDDVDGPDRDAGGSWRADRRRSYDRRPLAQRRIVSVVKPIGSPQQASRPGMHRLYGSIATLAGSLLTIRLRSDRLQRVDASTTVATGDYSAPLFVGKLIGIDGEIRGSTVVASRIDRLPNLERLPEDRETERPEGRRRFAFVKRLSVRTRHNVRLAGDQPESQLFAAGTVESLSDPM